jgi:hypothetical protein
MIPVMTTEPITAIGTYLRGLLVSPASSMPCRKPRKENTMPDVAIAVATPRQPKGMNSFEVKLELWNCVTTKAITTRVMMASFHQTITVFTRANHATPM